MNIRHIVCSVLLGAGFGGLWADEEAAAKEKIPEWNGALSISMTFTDGNSNAKSSRVAFNATREMHDGSMDFYGDYNESSSEGKTSSRNMTAGLKYNYDIGERSYLFIGYEVYKNKFKRIELRNKAIAGYGYKVIDKEKTTFNVEAGLAWIHESYIVDSSSTSSSDDKDYIALRFADEYEHTFENGVQVFQKAEYVPSIEKSSDYMFTSTQGIRTKLTTAWSLESSVKVEYINNVPRDKFGVKIPRADGHDVRRLDTTYYTGVTYSF